MRFATMVCLMHSAAGRNFVHGNARWNASSRRMAPFIRDVTLPLSTGDVKVPAQSPVAMLHVATQTSQAFRVRMLDRLRAHPCSPDRKWGIILYADEVSPQNPLAAGPDHRKVQVIYWTLRELGDDTRCFHRWQRMSWVRFVVHPLLISQIRMLDIN